MRQSVCMCICPALMVFLTNHGCLQSCAGQDAACEAGAIDARRLFEQDTVKAILLVDSTNVFSNLNREATLQNIRILCPTLALMLINAYRDPAKHSKPVTLFYLKKVPPREIHCL